MKFYKVAQYLVVGSFLFFSPSFALAGSLGISVDQVAIVFDTNSGESQEFIVKVKNISDEEYNIKIDKNDYILGDNNILTLSDEVDEVNGLKDWINPRDENVILAPGKEVEIIFDVIVPDNASVGSHKGAVIFRVESKGNDTVRVEGQVGVHVLINVKGDTHASGRVNSFDVPLLVMGPVEYAAEFENTGNIHYVPYGEVVVQNIFTKNESVYKYDKHFVFPDKKFVFSMTKEIPSVLGLYKVKTTFVDGEGATRSKIDFMMGYFFPLILIGVVGIIFIILRKVFKRDKVEKLKKDSKINKSIKSEIENKFTDSKKENKSVDEQVNVDNDVDEVETKSKKESAKIQAGEVNDKETGDKEEDDLKSKKD